MAFGNKSVDAFTIKCSQRGATLDFFGREPEDVSQAIDYFSIRVTSANLEAAARVYADNTNGLVCLFEEIAAEWRGWNGFKAWDSLEGELKIRCGNDRRGHIVIQIEMHSGHYDLDWHVQSAVMAEAGQLDALARGIREFFGLGR